MNSNARWLLAVAPIAALMTACAAEPTQEKNEKSSQALCPVGGCAEPPEPQAPTFTCPTGDCHYRLENGQCVYYTYCLPKGVQVGSVYNPCPTWAPNYYCDWTGTCYCY